MGLFPARRNVHRHLWWSLRQLSNKLTLFSIELDLFGLFLWTIGAGLITTVLSLSEKMQAGIGMWMGVLLVGGSLTIIALVVWEVWLNNGLKAIGRNVTLDERTTIHGPAGYDSVSLDCVAAQISARIPASQDVRKVTRWRVHGSRERSRPLFRTRLLKRRTIPLGCLIGFLANFSMRIGVWAVWERPELLPFDYRQLVESVQEGEILTNVYDLIATDTENQHAKFDKIDWLYNCDHWRFIRLPHDTNDEDL